MFEREGELRPPTTATTAQGTETSSFSGKSTVLLSMLREIELDSGSITVDGFDICTVPREKLRAIFTAISQDTFVLNDSIRRNIDPSGTASDEQITGAFQKGHLWDPIRSRNAKTAAAVPTSIDTTASTDDASRGTTDLLAAPLQERAPIARPAPAPGSWARLLLLRDRSRILLLDEATSSVDASTDALVQRVVRERVRAATRSLSSRTGWTRYATPTPSSSWTGAGVRGGGGAGGAVGQEEGGEEGEQEGGGW